MSLDFSEFFTILLFLYPATLVCAAAAPLRWYRAGNLRSQMTILPIGVTSSQMSLPNIGIIGTLIARYEPTNKLFILNFPCVFLCVDASFEDAFLPVRMYRIYTQRFLPAPSHGVFSLGPIV